MRQYQHAYTLYQEPDMSSDGMPEPMAKRFGYAVKLAQHALRIRMDEALRPLGLTAPQYAVLSAVELDSGLSNASLARAAFVTPQTMQGILANLEREKLLVRRADPNHGRILRTRLTGLGRKALSRAHYIVSAVEGTVIAAIGAEEAEQMTPLLLQCAKALAQADKLRPDTNARRHQTPRRAACGRARRARR
jgi:DNA-binding MarR family transcriptional regulator